MPGFMIINPNESRSFNLVRFIFRNGERTMDSSGQIRSWLNLSVSLRARNLNGQSLKVNDKMGNPDWNCSCDCLAGTRYGESTLKWTTTSCMSTFRGSSRSSSGEIVSHTIIWKTMKPLSLPRQFGESSRNARRRTFNERLGKAGIFVSEAKNQSLCLCSRNCRRHAFASASSRSCSPSANRKGAVGMVEMVCLNCQKKQIVTLDEERQSCYGSNLLLWTEIRNVSPVVNTGTLYN